MSKEFKQISKTIRSKVIPVRFTPDERGFIKIAADKFNISLSEFIRRATLARRMPAQSVAKINRKTYQELCRIGNNLNQLLRHLNSGSALNLDKKILIDLKEFVKKIGFEVVGSTSVLKFLWKPSEKKLRNKLSANYYLSYHQPFLLFF